jgi:nicotinamide mononucleotide transporter
MIDFFVQTFSGFKAMSYWEYLAVLLSAAYLLLAMKQSLWCWPAAFFSTFIYTILFFNGALLMDSLLNVFYMAMAFYGWYSWRNGLNKSAQQRQALPVKSWSWQLHSRIIAVTLILSVILGFVMDNYTHADFAYLDSFTTCFSVLSTYLVARKVLENWLYWVFIDGISVYLYISKGFYPTAVLFVLYTLMAVWGYMQWRQTLFVDTSTAATP